MELLHTNQEQLEKLRRLILKTGLKKKHIADLIPISNSLLINYLSNKETSRKMPIQIYYRVLDICTN